MRRKSLIVVLLITIPAFSVLLQKGYFSMHDDLQSMRQLELDKCFHDGQFPCRWVLDMGYGYGYPLFNYYPPLPYLVGQVFRFVGFAYIDVVKLVGITGFVTTAVFMYLLGRKLWGEYGGVMASVLYTYAPYHSVDFYVRGAMNEFWAMAFYPAALLTSLNLIQTGERKWMVLTALSVAAIMLSHNPMLLIFAPVMLTWCIFFVIKLKRWKAVWTLALAAICSLGLAAFFTLPVLIESKYVSLWTLTSGYFNYLAHFLNWRQIFVNINWGYGSSVLGPNDTMSFAIGYLHWIVPILLLPGLLFKKIHQHWPLILLLLFFIGISLFMTHSKSTEIWKILTPLEFLQFPWRFLTVAVFAASLLSGAITIVFNNKLLLASVLALTLLLNANYFRPRQWYPDMTDAKKFSGHSWQLLITSGIFDYLPVYAPQPPADQALQDVKFIAGLGESATITKKTNLQKYNVNVITATATAQLQTYYFPGWKIWVDNKEVNIDPKRDPILGRMNVDLSLGSHVVLAKFTNTPIRTVGNTLSLISWAAAFGTMIVWNLKRT